jgi:hypothetical protein
VSRSESLGFRVTVNRPRPSPGSACLKFRAESESVIVLEVVKSSSRPRRAAGTATSRTGPTWMVRRRDRPRSRAHVPAAASLSASRRDLARDSMTRCLGSPGPGPLSLRPPRGPGLRACPGRGPGPGRRTRNPHGGNHCRAESVTARRPGDSRPLRASGSQLTGSGWPRPRAAVVTVAGTRRRARGQPRLSVDPVRFGFPGRRGSPALGPSGPI